MKKEESIKYINYIRRFLNLQALCNEYNSLYPENAIDYNNLRCTINGKAPNRLSEDKINSFVTFLKKDIFINKFLRNGVSNDKTDKAIKETILKHTEELTQSILEVLSNDF
ncbi:MAG: hypothetical protein ACI4IW_01345 [Oscillospiraceae bacterium]